MAQGLFARWWGSTKMRLTDTAWSAWFGTGNYADKVVTIDTALTLSTVWSCVRLISETIGYLPLNLYERSSGRRVVAEKHAIHNLIHRQPNGFQTPSEFWEGMVASLALQGMAYAPKTYNGAKDVISLSPWDPCKAEPWRDLSGKLWYRVHFADGRFDEHVDPKDMFVVKGFTDNRDPDLGMSAITYGRQTFGGSIAIEEATAKTFKKGLVPAGYFQLENPAIKLDEDKRAQLHKVLKEFVDGSDASKQLLLEAGLSWKAMNLTPEDAQMLATRAFNVEEICRWFRVPPFMIGHTEKVTSWGTGMEQQMLGFVNFTLMPYLTRIEQAINLRLLSVEDRGRYYAKFSVEGLLRGDSAARAALYASAAQNGWMTRNEIRELEDWDALGAQGDIATVQSQLVPLDMLRQVALKPSSGVAAPQQPPGG